MGTAPKTAFVLAGGGSLGAAEVGMLRALAAVGVRPDLIVGASAGAINGAHFAADPSPAGVAKLEQVWRGITRRDVMPMRLRDLLRIAWRRDHMVDPAACAACSRSTSAITGSRTPQCRCMRWPPTGCSAARCCCRRARWLMRCWPAPRSWACSHRCASAGAS